MHRYRAYKGNDLKKLLRNFMIFAGFIFMLYTSYFLYFYSKRAEYAAILLQKALRYEGEFFTEKTQNLDPSEQTKLRHEFEKEKLKLEKYCSDAIINGENGYCKVYYNLDFDYIHFYDGRNQDIALGYDFDNESIEFYKKLSDRYDYKGKKCRSRRVYSEHHATFAIDNFEYATFWLGDHGEFTLKDPYIHECE